MRFWLGLSFSLHVALIGATLISMPFMRERLPEIETPIPVELVDIGELTTTIEPAPAEPAQPPPQPELPDTSRNEQEDPAPTPEPEPEPEDTPEPIFTPEPAQPEDDPITLSTPTPEPSPQPRPSPRPEPSPEPTQERIFETPAPFRAKPSPTPGPSPTPRPSPSPSPERAAPVTERTPEQSDIDSLLNDLAAQDLPEPQPRQTPQPNVPVDPNATRPLPRGRFSDVLSVSAEDALRYQISQCWVVPNAQGRGVESMTVELLVEIGRDRIARNVQIIDRDGQMGDPVYRALAESASRAVRARGCRPLVLPEDRYNDWRTLRIRFTPEDIRRAR